MPPTSDVVCPTCTASVALRVSRTGFLQKVILARLGIYPWKCGACGSTFLSRNRGPRAERRRADSNSAGQRERA